MEATGSSTLNIDSISKGLSDRIDDFTSLLTELVQTADAIFEMISIEMLEDGADTETLGEIADAVSTAISGFDIEREDEDGKIC